MKQKTISSARIDGLWLSQNVALDLNIAPAHGVPIQFIKGSGQRYSTVIHRTDKVAVEVVAGGYNKVGGPACRIPHDLAHYIVEDELQLDFGLWGLLSGGLILPPKNARVIAGRLNAYANQRSQALKKRAGNRPMQVELAVRTIADLALAGHHRDISSFHKNMGTDWPSIPINVSTLETTCLRLQEYGVKWQKMSPFTTLDVIWNRPAIS